MPTIAEARKTILSSVSTLGAERVGLLESCGRVLAEEVRAQWDMPQWDNSAMDGFAVRTADCAPGVELPVAGYIPAGGTAESPLLPGTAIRIMTGAPVPEGCDAVVPVEETSAAGGRVVLHERVEEGQHIRRRGEDIACGEAVLHPGEVIHPAQVSLLASLGRTMVAVYRRPRVGIVSTGDELLEPGEQPAPGKIVNSNSYALAAAVREAGGEPVILGVARDDLESHREKLSQGLGFDVLVTSAGVSAGDRDLVRDVLAELGAEQVFWKVKMKPGGPTAFALYRGKPVFCLPGNPVSTLVTFDMFVRPALLRMTGRRRVLQAPLTLVLAEPLSKKEGKEQLVRLKLQRQDGKLAGSSPGSQQTAILKTMLLADVLAVLPSERTRVEAGEEVQGWLLREEALMLEE
ncbi:MAG TPA: gephyrin-like molybdotransferase Glp [Verrucomicrobiae bacterium]|nr:gephyrin-like molybdotransferase Glp [Verrucomicrobiae bacterium]